MDLDIILKLMHCFPGSKINQFGEFIAHEKGNAYFNLKNCKSELDIKCKILEWFSRDAYKAEPFRQKAKNDKFHEFMLDGINKYLATDFTHDDMELIYCKLGNAVNHELTVRFIESGFVLSVLRKMV